MMTDLKVFIAAPISGFNDNNLYLQYRKGVLSLIDSLRNSNYIVFSELEKFNDLGGYDDPASAATEDLKKIAESDIFILFHPFRMQTSSFIELGYALAHNKKIVIISKENDLPFLALGLPKALNNVSIISIEELNSKAIQTIIKVVQT